MFHVQSYTQRSIRARGEPEVGEEAGKSRVSGLTVETCCFIHLHSPSFTFIHLHLSSQAGSHSTDMESEGNALSGSAISVVLPEINKGRERPG